MNENSFIESENQNDLDVMKGLLPGNVEALKKHGKFEIRKKFNEMLSKEMFPMDNIAFLLFFAVFVILTEIKRARII